MAGSWTSAAAQACLLSALLPCSSRRSVWTPMPACLRRAALRPRKRQSRTSGGSKLWPRICPRCLQPSPRCRRPPRPEPHTGLSAQQGPRISGKRTCRGALSHRMDSCPPSGTTPPRGRRETDQMSGPACGGAGSMTRSRSFPEAWCRRSQIPTPNAQRFPPQPRTHYAPTERSDRRHSQGALSCPEPDTERKMTLGLAGNGPVGAGCPP